jgi:hypothetical protein
VDLRRCAAPAIVRAPGVGVRLGPAG